MPVHNHKERVPIPPVAGPSQATPSRDPQRDLREVATHADHLRRIVSELPPIMLNGAARKREILDEIERASHPEPTVSRFPFHSDTLPPSYLPRIIAGILGGTGIGKSTLISSILGRTVSPTSVLGRGTAAPTIIAYHEHDWIEATLSFLPEKEFRTMIETALELLERGEDGRPLTEGELKKDPSYALVTEALDLTKKKLASFKKGAHTEREDGQDGSDRRVQAVLDLYPDIANILGTTITIQECDDQAFVKALESHIGAAKEHKGPKKWALLAQLLVKCNADVLKTGLIVIDFPGSGDYSPTVLRMIAEVQSKLDVKLVAVRPARVSTEAMVNELMREEIERRTLHTMQGHEGDAADKEDLHNASSSGLAVIMTQCDAEAAGELADDDATASILKQDTEYKNVRLEIGQAQITLDEKRTLLGMLQSQQTRAMKSTSSAPGSKRVSQYNLRSNSPPKRPRLSGSSASTSSVRDVAYEDADEDNLRTIVAKLQDAEAEVAREQARLENLESQRRALEWIARQKVLGAHVRRHFNSHMCAARSAAAPDSSEDEDMDDDEREDFSLPIFTTSAKNFNYQSPGDEDLKGHTGIPALRSFLLYQGARAEDQAVLDLLRQFRDEVKSTHTLLTAKDRETVGEKVAREKLALQQRWASVEAGADARGVAGTSANAATSGSGIRDSLNAIFAATVEAKIEEARAGLEILKETCEAGATVAAQNAKATAQSLVEEKIHWGKHRAVLKNHGTYKDVKDYNVELTTPFIAAVEEAIDKYRQHGIVFGLPNKIKEQANAFFDEVHDSVDKCDKSLKEEVYLRIHTCREDRLCRGLSRIKKAGKELLKEKRGLSESTFFSDAVKGLLGETYTESVKQHKGRNSIAKMKTHFVDAVGVAADALFRDMVQDFLKRQRELIDDVETLVKKELKRVARKCEIEISNAWVVPDNDKAQLDARADAAKAVHNIEQRLAALETELVERMKQAEKAVPTCHPLCNVPKDATS
ncbi:unnamed protein product [Peniophora sp. CBMAI 1063]|nr:unnamed protein product [Peniophora sp. CBMAI 1063]